VMLLDGRELLGTNTPEQPEPPCLFPPLSTLSVDVFYPRNVEGLQSDEWVSMPSMLLTMPAHKTIYPLVRRALVIFCTPTDAHLWQLRREAAIDR
jgi:hypothetical protein